MMEPECRPFVYCFVTFGEVLWLLLGAFIGAVTALAIPYVVRFIARAFTKPPSAPST